MCLRLHTWRGNVARVKQSCLTADIWLWVECGNTIPDRSKGQHIQLLDAREWLRATQGGSRVAQEWPWWFGVYYTYSKLLNALKVKGQCKLNIQLSYMVLHVPWLTAESKLIGVEHLRR